MRKLGSDGKPLMLNKRGLYVLDQKLWNAQLKAAQAHLTAHPEHESVPSTSDLDTMPSRYGTANLATRVDAVRSALRHPL